MKSCEQLLMLESTLHDPVESPSKVFQSALVIFERHLNPVGIVIKNWSFDSRINYKGYVNQELGCFTICKIETLYSLN